MTANVNLSASLTPAVAPAAPAARAGTGDGADTGFAQCLDQARDSEALSEADPVEDAAHDTPRTPGKARPARGGTAADSARRGAPAPDATKPPAAGASAATDVGLLEAPAQGDPHDDAAVDAAIDLATLLPGWVASAAPAPVPAATQPTDDSVPKLAVEIALSLPVAPEVRRSPALVASSVAAAAPAAVAAAGEARPARPERGEAQAADLVHPDLIHADLVHADSAHADSASAPHVRAAPDAPLHNAVAGSTRSLQIVERTDHDSATVSSVFSLPPAQVGPAATPASAPTAPIASAHVAAAVDSAAFAPSLATQVRWLVREGVQRAELTLNPAEMGPVVVAIAVVDGREARIDFSADLAATRVALEASLPVLAAALDDSGLKLTGGGVHDGQARHQPAWGMRAAAAPRGDATVPGDEGVAPLASTQRGLPQRGLIDLVA